VGISATHELIHTFVGRLTGSQERNTPPNVTFPRLVASRTTRGTGESGNYFEGVLSRFLVQAYYDPASRLGERQAGVLYAVPDTSGTGWIADRNWMVDRLSLDFGSGRRPAFPPPTNNWARRRVPGVEESMEELRLLRQPPLYPGDEFDLDQYLADMNRLPTYRTGSNELRRIMRMATDVRYIRS